MQRSMPCIRRALVAILVGSVSFAGLPAAGQGGDASIIGQVTDATGAILPGVTVTLTSPALQVPSLTGVTNERGEYRFAPLPVGTYQVAFDLSGFRPGQRQNVRLTVGFTARIDIALGLASVAETVTVSGAAPVVDVTATSGATLFTKETLELMPSTRNGPMSLLTMAPGVRSFVDIGGSLTEENPGAKAFGQAGQIYYTIEGVFSNTWSNSGAGGAFWDFQAIDEARVQSMATDPEFPTRGVQISAVVKSGGNDFHGGGFFATNGRYLESENLDDNLRSFGIETGNSIRKQFDFSGDLGGRIIPNKLWFYGAVRYRDVRRPVLGAFSEIEPADAILDNIVQSKFVTQKYSYQATTAHRFVFFSMWEHLRENAKHDSLRAWESREDKDTAHPPLKFGWEGQFGNSVAANFQFGYVDHDSIAPFLNVGRPRIDQIGRTDLTSERVTGENVVGGERVRSFTRQTKGSLTYYKGNWAGGNHEFKVGGEYGRFKNYRSLEAKPINYHLQYTECPVSCADGGIAERVVFFNSPVFPDGRQHTSSFFGRDSWTIGRRLTLNLGARYAHTIGFAPEQSRQAASGPSAVLFPAATFPRVDLKTWNAFEPRLHSAFDVTGDGKTVFKGGWGRYHHMRLLTPDVLNFVRNSIVYDIFSWTDPNGNNDYDAGEVNLDPNGPDFIEQTGMEFDDLPPNFVLNNDEKQPVTDELSLSMERELIPNFALRVTGLYTRTSDIFRVKSLLQPYDAFNIPITNRDPGADGTLGTGDDGNMVTYYEYAPELAGAGQLQNFNDPKAGPQTYKSIEVAGVKRLSNRWSLMVSYSATKKNKPINAGLAVGAFDSFNTDHVVGAYNPNTEIFRADKTWDWDSKVLASYNFPGDVLLSTNFHHQSGEAYARQVRFSGGVTIPAITLNVEPIGEHRLPAINLLTFRVEKAFRLAGSNRIAIRLDLHNALNANTVTENTPRSGANFLAPRAILGPRIGEVSATYTF